MDDIWIAFYKYQGCGNDFIMIDNRTEAFEKYAKERLIQRMCDRRFGIGADGLISISRHKDLDFEMVYYNADGKIGTMCGNGARCSLAFAQLLGLYKQDEVAAFWAIDGEHIGGNIKGQLDIYEVKMADVQQIRCSDDNCFFMDTGSPHHVTHLDKIDDIDVKVLGEQIRNSPEYKHISGTNANFVQIEPNGLIKVRTFERGVEDETLACGTGSVAVALSSEILSPCGKPPIRNVSEHRDTTGDLLKTVQRKVQTFGGDLDIRFTMRADTQQVPTAAWDIYLIGPAVQVFQGNYKLKLI